ncbi:MAG: hypothetical protein U5O39_09570 [Gammaproteobacteria bacterium]|nr:hypothetical protein [Gammaproteobacteria bacterium]
MPDWPKLVAILVLWSAPLAGYGGQAASVTVSFSVHVPAPEDRSSPRQTQASTREKADCDALLSSARRPDATTCREGLTVYTWNERDEATLLTIAPI